MAHLDLFKSVDEKDADTVQNANEDNLDQPLAALTIRNSTDPGELDDSVSYARKSKVWNEPVYNKKKNIPSVLNLQPSQDYEPPPVLDDSQTPLHVEVEKGIKFFGTPGRMYPMQSKPRGYALIINNQDFDIPETYPFRKGAHVDSENLDNLFSQLGFEVLRYKNLKRNETLKKLIEFSELPGQETADMMIVCVLSHGSEHGKIVSSDCMPIDTEVDILRRFNNDYCPQLKGKPKFFIIQACRGEQMDYGILSPSGDTTDAVVSQPGRGRKTSFVPQYKEPSWEDILIAYATLPGYVANRDHHRGTWFIESICKVFMKHAKDMDLRDMLDEVAFELSGYESEMGTKQSFNYDVRHFYKKLYFNPGINIEIRDQWKHANSIDFDSIQSQEKKEDTEILGLRTTKKRTISHSGPIHQQS